MVIEVLVGKKNKNQNSYFVRQHTQPFHSCSGLKHITGCCKAEAEARAHTQMLRGAGVASASDSNLCSDRLRCVRIHCRKLHKPMRNPKVT